MQTENSLPSAINTSKFAESAVNQQGCKSKLPQLLNSSSVLALHKHFQQPDLTKQTSTLTGIPLSPSPARSQPSLSLSLEEPDRAFGLDISDRVINQKKSDLSSEPGFIQSSSNASEQLTGSLEGDEQDPYSLLKLPEEEAPSPNGC